jgi:hypothetical protein
VPRRRFADREDDGHRLGVQPPRDEAEHLARSAVEPLRVVHDTEQRPILRDGRQQAERREGHEETVGSLPRGQAQGDAQGFPLRLREGLDQLEHRRAQLMNAGEGQFHLGLDARDMRDPETRRLPGAVLEQRRLPDTGFAPNHHDPALAFAHVRQEPVEQLTLSGSAQQRGRTARGHQ